MKSEELSELELFRMAVRLAEAALMNVPNALNCINRADVIHDRIIECHSAIRRAAEAVMGTPSAPPH